MTVHFRTTPGRTELWLRRIERWIRSIRQRLGLRQRDVAAKLGVGLITLQRAERGRIEGKWGVRGTWMPRLSLLQGVAELGGVTVDWLLRG